VIAEDVAERMRMRTELAFADRLASVGALAAGVAHEVNNPLTYVLFHLERLAASVPEPDAGRARAALDGAERIRDIVRDLQTFARVEKEGVEPVDVHAVLDKVLALAAPELRYRARIVRDLGAGGWARANEGRLAQVFLNLVINAAHAMDDGRDERGELRVATRDEGDRLVIEIADSGVGIAPSDLARIFEPFFSTRATTSAGAAKGSGLGLSICRNIVERLGGTIEVTSALGRGSRFTVRIPAARGEPPAREGGREVGGVAGGRARVLVIDDDPRLLAMMAALLEGTHEIVTALGGAAAIARLERESFDAIACDLMMPEVDGVAVHDWLRLHRPELMPRIFFLTGGAFTPRGEAFVARAGALVLSKPTRPEELLAAIERARAAEG
jgi:CheY-like chemotaxis protein